MRSFPRRLLLLAALVATALVGCAEETSEPVPEEVLEPIAVTREVRSFGYFPGDDTFIAPSRTELQEHFEHVTFRVQMLDELRLSRPEGTVANSSFAARVDALIDEAQGVLTIENEVLVLDLMRLSNGATAGAPTPYLVSWDGNNRPIENYGFWRSDYRQAVLSEIETAARAQKPAFFIVGAEMERLLDMPGGESDYANFVSLYREAYAVIKRESPQTRVGAGIDWVRLVQDLAPQQQLTQADVPDDVEVPEGTTIDCAVVMDSAPDTEESQALRLACVDKAFARYVEPLLRYLDPNQPAAPPEGDGEGDTLLEAPVYVHTADVLALAAIGTQDDFDNDPSTAPDDLLAALRPWSRRFPVAWYEVNWHIGGPVGASLQQDWLVTLIERSLGVTTELIGWKLLKDLLANDCGKLTNDLGAPASICFAGLWAESTAPKDVYDTFITDVVPEPAQAP